MRRSTKAALGLAMLAALSAPAVISPARAETPEEWIALGSRVHGGFGTFIPVGIRIGLDAVKRLGAKPRELEIVYYDNDKVPCACFLDGVMIATTASPGQRTVTVAARKAPEGSAAMIEIRHRKTGAGVRYKIPETWLLKLAQWNRTLDERGRYDEVMKAEGLFEAEEIQQR